RLDERVEVDDAYLGGERSGGKAGRGAPGKTPFVAAVQTSDDGGRPLFMGSRPCRALPKRPLRSGRPAA
ncbi:MAG: transposase, partial [Burkholderia sp.]